MYSTNSMIYLKTKILEPFRLSLFTLLRLFFDSLHFDSVTGLEKVEKRRRRK